MGGDLFTRTISFDITGREPTKKEPLDILRRIRLKNHSDTTEMGDGGSSSPSCATTSKHTALTSSLDDDKRHSEELEINARSSREAGSRALFWVEVSASRLESAVNEISPYSSGGPSNQSNLPRHVYVGTV